MSREEKESRTGSDTEINPYAAPLAPLGSAGGRLWPETRRSPRGTAPISVVHGLTEDELRRFGDCDAFYDPLPLFGFIPQWVWLIPITAAIGFIFGMGQIRSYRWAAVWAPAMSVIVLAVMVAMAKARRNTARLAGLSEDRTLTITPEGLTLTIPGARPVPKELATVAPSEHPWGDFRKIGAMDDDITFWLKGRLRLVLPRRAFPSPAEADAFLQAAICWHAEAV